jgi:hypothetical protein
LPPSAIRRTKKKEPREWANPQGFEAITGEYTERITILSQEAPMRALSDADVEAIRSAFDSVLAALPQDRLRNLVLELMFSPFTTTTQHRKRGRPRKHADEGNVVSLHQRKPGRKRRRKSVDAAKLAARRKRYVFVDAEFARDAFPRGLRAEALGVFPEAFVERFLALR